MSSERPVTALAGPRLRHTSGFRLAVSSTVLAVVAAGLVLYLIYYGTVGLINRTIEQQIIEETGEIVDGQSQATPASLVANMREESAEAPHATIMALVEPDGRVIAGNISHPPLVAGWSWYKLRISSEDRKKTELIRGHGVRLADGGLLYVGKDATIFSILRDRMDDVFGISFLTLTMFGVGGGVLLGRGAASRVKDINRTLLQAMAGDFSHRVPRTGRDDEFDHLAKGINVMLERTEILVENIKQTGNEIAHDLRSPMARLRSGLELALIEPDREQLIEAVALSIVQTDQILEIFSSLLRLAQIESGARRSSFTRVDLSGLLENLIETYHLSIETRGRTLLTAITPDLMLQGDSALLTQMLANILQNAEKFTPDGGRISIFAMRCEAGLEIQMEDTGPGIPDSLHATALRRFGRIIDTARTTPGAGLGLPLAVAIAELHGGKLQLEDTAPGLRVRILLPHT